MATNNQISEDDIKILMDQTNINREIAKRLLKDNSGDIVECIIKIETENILEKYNNLDKVEIEEDNTNEIDEEDKAIGEVILNNTNLEKYRKIVDNKDNIYNEHAEKKEKIKKREKLIQERKEKGESVDDLLEKKMSCEDLYYLRNKGNLTSIRVL